MLAMYEGHATKSDAILDGEAQEVVIITDAEMNPDDWAFPMHFAFARRALSELKMVNYPCLKEGACNERNRPL